VALRKGIIAIAKECGSPRGPIGSGRERRYRSRKGGREGVLVGEPTLARLCRHNTALIKGGTRTHDHNME
jgi:hypothetical protein